MAVLACARHIQNTHSAFSVAKHVPCAHLKVHGRHQVVLTQERWPSLITLRCFRMLFSVLNVGPVLLVIPWDSKAREELVLANVLRKIHWTLEPGPLHIAKLDSGSLLLKTLLWPNRCISKFYGTSFTCFSSAIFRSHCSFSYHFPFHCFCFISEWLQVKCTPDCSFKDMLKSNRSCIINDRNHLVFIFLNRKVNKCLAKPHLLCCCCGAVGVTGKTIPPSQGWTKIRLHLQDVNANLHSCIPETSSPDCFWKALCKSKLVSSLPNFQNVVLILMAIISTITNW